MTENKSMVWGIWRIYNNCDFPTASLHSTVVYTSEKIAQELVSNLNEQEKRRVEDGYVGNQRVTFFTFPLTVL